MMFKSCQYVLMTTSADGSQLWIVVFVVNGGNATVQANATGWQWFTTVQCNWLHTSSLLTVFAHQPTINQALTTHQPLINQPTNISLVPPVSGSPHQDGKRYTALVQENKGEGATRARGGSEGFATLGVDDPMNGEWLITNG